MGFILTLITSPFWLTFEFLKWIWGLAFNNDATINERGNFFSKIRMFNPITWNLFFRPIATVVVCAFYTLLGFVIIAGFNWMLASDNKIELSAQFWLGVYLLLLIAGNIGVGESETVPETKFYALVTWLGMTTPIIRLTGRYGWLGTKLGFGRTGRVTPEFTTPEGFIRAGEIPFKVWNNGHDKSPVIIAPAKNRADIKGTLTLILQSVNPKLTLDSTNPELDIGERARQEFREMVTRFVDTDIPSLAQSTGEVLTGKKLVTCFLPRAIIGKKAGAMIRDDGGNALFAIIGDDEETDISNFSQKVMSEADEDMLKAVITTSDTGEVTLKLRYIQLEKPITEVLTATGFELKRVTFADITLSGEVTKAANQASSEPDQRIAQIASAETNKAARKAMLPDEEELKNPAWETAMIIAAAQDNQSGSIRVVLVPGGNKLAQAAVAGASQFGGNTP